MHSQAPIARRTFLAGLAAAATAPSALAVDVPPPEDDGYRELVLNSELQAWIDAYGRPTAKVMLGQAGPFDFLVDTGANITVISMSRALEGGAVFVGESTVHGTTGSMLLPIAMLPELSSGVLRRRNVRVAVFPDERFLAEQGILGAEIFAGRRLTFDIPGRSVRIEPSNRGASIDPVANLRMRNGMLAEISGRIGRVRARLMLDTGAQQSIANPALDAALRRHHPNLPRIPRVRVTGVTGHVVQGELIELPRAVLGGLELTGAAAVAADASIFRVWGLDGEPAMIVGVDVLSRMQGFTIDYGTRRFTGRPLALLAGDDHFALG